MKYLIINPGATSTKIAVFDENREVFTEKIDHEASDLKKFPRISDQMEFRRDLILKVLSERGYKMSDFGAVCGRGGLLRHIPSGTYLVDEDVIKDLLEPPYGEHAANLGAYISKDLGDSAGIPSFFVDPVCVDELSDLARISGMKGMERQSFFHALNQKSVARRLAADIGRKYEDARLIVIHMGGGVSVAAHENGRCTDMFNVKDDGSMGLDRGGALPVNAVINFCFSGKTKEEVKRILGREAGVYSYLGTKNFQEVETRAFEENDREAELIFNALAYQLAKDVGAMAAVLSFEVDAIAMTGGMANSKRFTGILEKYIKKLAPVYIYPGEEEMKSLARGVMRAMSEGNYKKYKENIIKEK